MTKRSGQTRAETHLSKTLRVLMTERGISVRRLAKELACSPSSIADWLAGHQPTNFSVIARMAKYFGLKSMEELLVAPEEGVADVPRASKAPFKHSGNSITGLARFKIEFLGNENILVGLSDDDET